MRRFSIDTRTTPLVATVTWSDYGTIFFRLLMVFSIVYLSALSTFTLSIDDESAALRTSDDAFVWLLQGRWTLYLIEKYIISRPAIITFPLMIFGMFASASYILIMKSMEVKLDDIRNYALFVIFCAFPTIFFITNFMSNLIGLGLGILCCCSAALVFKQELLKEPFLNSNWIERLTKLCLQLVFICCAAGAYQSLLMLAFAAYIGISINHFSAHQELSLRRLIAWQIYSLLVVALGGIFNLVIGSMLDASNGHGSSYTSIFLRPELLFDMPLPVIRIVFADYKAVYGGSSQVFAFDYSSIPALISLGALAALLATAARSIPERVYISLCLAALTLIPFALNFLTGGSLPYRTLLAVPFVVWLFACAANFSRNYWLRNAGIILTIVVAIQCVYTLTLLQTNKRLVLQSDVQLASRIFERISTAVPNFSMDRTYPIDFYGAQKFIGPYQDVAQSTYSASFFEWNDGNSDRILEFFNVIGYTNLVRPSGAQRLATMPHWKSMPVWPQIGSVQFIDETILVRLGENPGLSHADLVTQ